MSGSPPLGLESNIRFVLFKHLRRLQSHLGQCCSKDPVLTCTSPCLSPLSAYFCLLCGARTMLHCCVLLSSRTEYSVYSTSTTVLSPLKSPSGYKVKAGVSGGADWMGWLTQTSWATERLLFWFLRKKSTFKDFSVFVSFFLFGCVFKIWTHKKRLLKMPSD